MNILDSELASNLPDNPEDISMYLASIVRNEIEDIIAKHIPDNQMPEFNKAIRDSLYTGLYFLQQAYKSEPAKACVLLQSMLYIPDYWEKPDLLESFQEMKKNCSEKTR